MSQQPSMSNPRGTGAPPGHNAFGRGRALPPALAALFVVAAAMLVLAVLAGSSSASRQRSVAGTPCPEATPPDGAPRPSAEGTPAFVDAATLCAAPGLGTPIAADDLTVTVVADDLQAGPRELTVLVADAAGQPVTGATVTIRTRSLEMDHGVSIDEAVETEPGRYFAERVSLGMGGDWLAEVTIERPGAEPVVLYVVLTLEGPRHGH